MKYLLLFFLLLPFTAFSQENKSVEIILKTDSIIKTNWIKLYDTPFFIKPYIKIDSEDGQKIRVQGIKNYKGTDQNSYYRRLSTIDLDRKKYQYTEFMQRKDSFENAIITREYETFGFWNHSSTSRQITYKLNNNDAKELNYNNIKYDFANLNYSNRYFQQARNIRILQNTSVLVATGLLMNFMVNNWDPSDGDFLNTKDNIILLTSGLLFVFPFTLENIKERKLINALYNY